MLHASETWPLTRPDLQHLRHNDRAMIRQICNVKPEDVATVRSNQLLAQLEIDDLDIILREKRLHWFGHIERSSGTIKTVRRKAWAKEAHDDTEDTYRERPL